MPNLPSNSHADRAGDRLDRAYTADPDHARYLLAEAQTEASLAVAHELRTANMLAALATTFADGSASFPGETDTLRADILSRLGYDAAWYGTLEAHA
ncbi:hypothetical protein GCM10025864_44930 [Luteimicrobium album]|uniref:Uncharacterized protein n=1 Tax=Luteimicrobium album TaxID=1054550 RepID=A0ABQ6HVU3_9MICO|nr:hypothetical protein [Luteimicrobium album]GMA22267.1 hypothetical protein GCM10025864_00260 [Luteimicrobium album]GMA26672.1 hypothetical protein GCM10025864_44310 [Luteimicrobium album]GMA26734.1 hypothetical protein GCM10025864_44930 [Luteimicrobium album]